MIKNIKGTYVARKVKQSNELYDFFKNQNIDVVPKDELHCTIAYSRKEFDAKLDTNPIEIKYDEDIYPYLEPLGDDGAIVMKFNSTKMQERFKDCISRGAVYDYDKYMPHITISYNGKDLNLKDIRMPDFNIDLIDEYSEPLDLNWKDKVIKDTQFTIDFLNSKIEKYIDEDTGFLHLDGVVARTGVQEYYGIELGDYENADKIFNVYRSKDEVLKKESLDSYINSIVTDDHPNEFVTVDNIKDFGKGSCANYEVFNKDGIDYVKAKLVVTDKDLIKKIQYGKVEISAGYTQSLVKEDGISLDGTPYQYKQTNIKINHIAIVDKARCGNKCKLIIDKSSIIESDNITKGEDMKKIKIGDSEFEVCDSIFSHIEELNKKLLDAEMKEEEQEDEEEQKDEEMQEEEKMTDADIAQVIDAKVEAILIAKDLKVDVKSTDSVLDIKKAIISAKSNISLDGKSEAYIDASFDILKDSIAKDAKKKKEVEQSHKKVVDGFETGANEFKFANLKDKEL